MLRLGLRAVFVTETYTQRERDDDDDDDGDRGLGASMSGSNGGSVVEEDEEGFVDYTTATAWESFSAEVEERLRFWQSEEAKEAHTKIAADGDGVVVSVLQVRMREKDRQTNKQGKKIELRTKDVLIVFAGHCF